MTRGTDILIVDDSASDVRILAELLSDLGSLSFAMTGAEALAKVSNARFDVILLDIILPDMTGFEVYRGMAEFLRPGETSVIFVTALDDSESEEHGLLLGAIDYIVKPFSPAAVRARVGNHLRLSRTTRELRLANEKLERLAALDFLTGASNRGHFERQAASELARSSRRDRPCALLLIDLDHFKRINDTHGHDMGDRVLMAVVDAWGRELRDGDILGRVGGEEFAVFLPETGADEAALIASRLLRLTSGLAIRCENGEMLRIAASIGCVWSGDDGATLRDLMKAADRMLYRAKRNGRDRVEIQCGTEEPGEC